MSLSNTILTGMNNPDCAFYVGQSLGYASAGTLIVRVTAVYFGVKLIDKILFTGIPNLYKKFRKQGKGDAQ